MWFAIITLCASVVAAGTLVLVLYAIAWVRASFAEKEHQILAAPATGDARIDNVIALAIRETARQQGRTVEDVVRDTLTSMKLNIADLVEMAAAQRVHPGLQEVWVFARRPADLYSEFYPTVRDNVVNRQVSYYYFTSDTRFFEELRERLLRDVLDGKLIQDHLHCVRVPAACFVATPGFVLWISDELPVKALSGRSVDQAGTPIEGQELPRDMAEQLYGSLKAEVARLYHRQDLGTDEAAFAAFTYGATNMDARIEFERVM